MKKNILLSLLSILLAFSGNQDLMARNIQVVFQFSYNGEALQINNASVSAYRQGRNVSETENRHFSDTPPHVRVLLPDSLVGKSLAYRSTLGHQGQFTVTENDTIRLECKRLTVKIADTDGNLLQDQSVMLTINDFTQYASTDRNGVAYLYAASGSNYNYSTAYGSSYVDLTEDTIVQVTAPKWESPAETTSQYRVTFVPHYGDQPVIFNNTFYIIGNGWSTNIWAYNGVMETRLAPGKYELQDPNGGRWPFTMGERDTLIYVDYHKVTITSKGTEPNPHVTLSIGNDYMGNGVTTDSNGQAVFYMIPGTYTYHHANGSGTLTVGNEDMTATVEAYRIFLNFTEVPQNPSDLFYVMPLVDGRESGSSMRFNANGNQLNMLLAPGDYILRNSQNPLGAVKFHIDNNTPALNMNVYALKYTTSDGKSHEAFLRQADTWDYIYSDRVKYYLEGDYEYSFDQHTWTTLKLDKDTEIKGTYYKLIVNVNDTDGEIVRNSVVYISTDTGYQHSAFLDNNGMAEFSCAQGSYTVGISGFENYSKRVTVSADDEITLTIPATITFTVTNEGDYVPYPLMIYPEGTNGTQTTNLYVNNDGKFTYRLDTSRRYCIANYYGSTDITDGCAISLGRLTVNADGMGLAFPMMNWTASSTFPVIVGSTVRLTAIPVRDDRFQNWTINGKEYESPVIEYTLKEPITTAQANFSGEATASVRSTKSTAEWTVESDGRQLRLPEEVNGQADIYTADGRKVRSFAVVGNTIGIYDLPEGTYILSLTTGSDHYSAKFLKAQ